MAKDLSKLQNGSDIRGIALEGVPGEAVNLTEAEATAIGAAFTYWLANKVKKNVFDLRICLGCDPRLSGEALKAGLAKGICYLGSRVSDAGLASTPAMFMSTVMPYFDFDGAVMVTASHLPFNRNGLKFFTREGGLDKEDIKTILDKAATLHVLPDYYEMEPVNVMDMYAAHLRMLISGKVGNLNGMKIVVDAGNGAGGFFATEVLGRLGADVSASQFLEPDGTFPNHQPNPENKQAMQAVCDQVTASGADLGIIFDTDVDRSAAVTPDGMPVGRNEIVALAAALVAADHPGGTVVTDSITSNELHDFLENGLGLRHYRYRRGYRNVINKAVELAGAGEDAFLAIETSGHAAYADNYYLDDGAYLAVLIVSAAARLKREGKSIGDLISGLASPAEATEYRMDITAEDFSSVGDRVLADLPAFIQATDGRHATYGDDGRKYRLGLSLEEPNYEGVRVNYRIVNLADESDAYAGWFLLRKSLHDPVLPLNVESDRVNGVARIVPVIRLYMKQFPEVRPF